MRSHTTDLFDSRKSYLATHEQEHRAHPLLVIDDAEGLRPSVLDTLGRLTAFSLDSEERFSVLLSGTDSLVTPNLSSTTLPYPQHTGPLAKFLIDNVTAT